MTPKEIRRAKYLKHKAKIQAHNQKPDVKARRQRLRKDYFQANKEYFRAYALQKKYGISYTQYLELIAGSRGVCPICFVPLVLGVKSKDCAVVDHNHETGKVRGVICSNCNRGIGFLSHKSVLLAAIAYLEKYD